MKIAGCHLITDDTIVNLMKVDSIQVNKNRPGLDINLGFKSVFVSCDTGVAMDILEEYYSWEPKEDENCSL